MFLRVFVTDEYFVDKGIRPYEGGRRDKLNIEQVWIQVFSRTSLGKPRYCNLEITTDAQITIAMDVQPVSHAETSRKLNRNLSSI